jgi:hypothetical protein
MDSGGYIGYEIDGVSGAIRGPQREPGPDGLPTYESKATAEVAVTTDGVHTVGYHAVDVAGNAAAAKSVSLKIDQTPPELAVFEAQRRDDARLVAVAASDRTSGLADGALIQLRRVAPSRGDWITLGTTRDNDHYYGRIDNATLPGGDYEFRATVPDQAGNIAVATSDRQGRSEILHVTPASVGGYSTVVPEGQLPQAGGPDAQDARATVDTELSARAVQRTVVRKKCKRAHRKLCPAAGTKVVLVHDLRVGFGKRAQIRGALVTRSGRPVAGVEVTVLARPTMSGGSYAAEATLRTNSVGTFTYRAPAGPGRMLDFHYAGDHTYKHADDQVTLRVAAMATISVNRHSARNGQHVLFTGRLLGRPYPQKGKVLDLQAYYRHKWRTFATPRAASGGRWRFRYRFQATRGAVLYRFRVHVRATSDYAYEGSYSKAVTVRVAGP